MSADTMLRPPTFTSTGFTKIRRASASIYTNDRITIEKEDQGRVQTRIHTCRGKVAEKSTVCLSFLVLSNTFITCGSKPC